MCTCICPQPSLSFIKCSYIASWLAMVSPVTSLLTIQIKLISYMETNICHGAY